MKKSLFPFLALCLSLGVTPAAIRINEVHFNPEGPDTNFEFIELKSTTNGVESLAGLSLVMINNALSEKKDGVEVRLNPGEIVEILDLGDLSTGSNGLLLLGNGYPNPPVGGPWSGAIDAATAIADPAGLGDSDIGTNTGMTLILVRNYNLTAGPKGTDIDKDVVGGAAAISTGNGIIDWNQAIPPPGAVTRLWADADVVDSIGTRDYADSDDPIDFAAMGNRNPYVPVSANINTTWSASSLGLRDPDTFARRLGSDEVNSAASYYGAKMNPTNPTPTDILYRTNRFFGPGNMLGQVTPGRPNLASTLTATDFRINEVNLNPSGSDSADDRYQFVEIINTDRQSRSLSGYWLILLDSYDGSADTNDSSPGVGAILEEWNLSDFATGPNGLLFLGDDFSPSYTAFEDAINQQTAIGDPVAKSGTSPSSGWGLGDLRFKDGFTLLLVKDYRPPASRDLDPGNTGAPIANPTPWASISDQIGFTQVGKSTIGRTYSAVDLRTVMGTTAIPDSFSRKAGNLVNNSAAAWYGGSFPGGASPMSLGFADSKPANAADTFAASWFGGFRGAVTPGQLNLSAAINPAAPPLAASIRINEVMINPTNDITTDTDKSNEYIEIASTNQGLAYLDGLWILVVDLNGTVGNIITGFPLNGYTTGTKGLVLLGDGFDNTNGLYVFNEGTLPPSTAAFDPPVGLEENELPNNGSAYLLVRGIKGPVTLLPNGKPTGDLDPENDGVLLAPSIYTDELVDSIVVNAINPGAGYGWINSTPLNPHHIARYPGNFNASSSNSWYYGQVPQTAQAAPLTNYAGSFSGIFQGAGSPGRANHAGTPGAVTAGEVIFNEINFNPAGADGNFEFIEILSTNGAARSLNGWSIIALDNQITNTGAIRHAWSLDGMATGTNGLFMLGNRYPLSGQNPWSPVMRPQTTTGDVPGRDGLESSYNDAVLAADTENLNLTLLLVRNFSRYINYDLDDKTGLVDSPGDGVFDGTLPWSGGATGIQDSIMLRSYVATIPPPANQAAPYPYDGWTYGLADLTTAFFPSPATLFYHPESIARFRGNNTPNDASAWYGGDLKGGTSGNDGNAQEYVTALQDPTHPPVPSGFLGRITPGQPNLTFSASEDPDQDGVPNLVEAAVNSDPFSSIPIGPLPAPVTITDAGQSYLGFTYPRIRSPLPVPFPVPYAAEAYIYLPETSPDLTTWTPDPASGAGALIPVGVPTANPDGVTENVTLRLPDPITTPPGRRYIRLRVSRR